MYNSYTPYLFGRDIKWAINPLIILESTLSFKQILLISGLVDKDANNSSSASLPS